MHLCHYCIYIQLDSLFRFKLSFTARVWILGQTHDRYRADIPRPYGVAVWWRKLTDIRMVTRPASRQHIPVCTLRVCNKPAAIRVHYEITSIILMISVQEADIISCLPNLLFTWTSHAHVLRILKSSEDVRVFLVFIYHTVVIVIRCSESVL